MKNSLDVNVKTLFQVQKNLYQEQGPLTYAERLNLLEQIEILLTKNENNICKALHQDLGKGSAESFLSEISPIKEEVKFAIHNLKNWMKPKHKKTPLALFKGKSLVYNVAKGVVLIISPWNYPFALTCIPIISAIAAGNRIIAKPSEFAPQSSSLLKSLFSQYFSEEQVSIVEGGVETSQTLLSLPFNHIFFTGSPRIGKEVMKRASEHLTPITLELGGKSPCIIDHDANLSLAAKRVIWGKFLNAGQTCVAPDYLLVHQKVRDPFILELKKEIQLFYGADPKASKDYGRIINKKEYFRLMELIVQIKENESIILGGECDEETLYISPTLVFLKGPDSILMEEEIFGPILPIMDFERKEDILTIIRKNPSPLAFYYFSDREEGFTDFLYQIPFGGGAFNDTILQVATPHLPFGGVGPSGFGQYHGQAGFLTFSHQKSIFYRSSFFDLPLRYPSYTDKKMKWLRFFLS